MSESIEQKCISKGVKLTDQRRVIAKVMSESTDHPDVDELYKRVSKLDSKISIATVYVNRGPGSFAGIRNALSTVKAIHLITKIDYYCYSFKDFKGSEKIKYENIPNLCNKFKIKKNLINPIYIG